MIVLPFMVNAALPEWSTFEFIILLADILLGIYAWAIFNLRLEKRIKSKLPNWRGSIMTAFTFLGTLIGGVTLVVGLLTINYNKYVKFKTPSYTSAVPLIKERLVIDEVKLGSTGDDVVVLQTLLYQDTEVYRGPASGYFGEVTRQGALKFQKKHGLDQSGIADLPTRNKLSEIYSYQTREYWLSMIRLMPIIAPITQSTQNVSNNAKWGVSERVEGTEHGWAMRVNNDSTMATAQEIFDALNVYRSKKGVRGLNWDGNLASFALERANFYKANGLDDHAGFKNYIGNDDNRRKLGFRGIGENGSIGYLMTGTHVIEWVFASDAPHDNNQLDSDWSDVRIGVSGTGVDIIFGSTRF